MKRLSFILITFVTIALAACKSAPENYAHIPGISGLASLGQNNFLTVHDTKYAPTDRQGIWFGLLSYPDEHLNKRFLWSPLHVDWGHLDQLPSDLEFAINIPNTNFILVGESGSSGSNHSRLFVFRNVGQNIKVETIVNWPSKVFNIEGASVCEVNGVYWFIFAERSTKRNEIQLGYAQLSIDTFGFSKVQFLAIPYHVTLKKGHRAVSDLICTPSGLLIAASADDPGNEAGPFYSQLRVLGKFLWTPNGPIIDTSFSRHLAQIAGFKIEALSLLQHKSETILLFGTDDESFGGTVRTLLLQ
ncbi:hypothetical protein AOB54_08575 [beta proteobacterium MWH-UniP1]